jgi:anaerobic selenocysteine-containing dehydrogenase
MKNAPKDTQPIAQSAPSRRGFFMGAAAASAAAVAVTNLPNMGGQATQTAKLPPAPENGGGYSLSEHVKRYYQTTRV